MTALLKVVPLWAWIALAAIIGIGVQTYRVQSVKAEYAEYVSQIETQKADAIEATRHTEQTRQAAVDQVTKNASDQKVADDARAAALVADADSLRKQTGKLLADKSALDSRLAARGKTINDLTALLAQLRDEADDYAGQLAIALTASRRAGTACENAYDAVRAAQ